MAAGCRKWNMWATKTPWNKNLSSLLKQFSLRFQVFRTLWNHQARSHLLTSIKVPEYCTCHVASSQKVVNVTVANRHFIAESSTADCQIITTLGAGSRAFQLPTDFDFLPKQRRLVVKLYAEFAEVNNSYSTPYICLDLVMSRWKKSCKFCPSLKLYFQI